MRWDWYTKRPEARPLDSGRAGLPAALDEKYGAYDYARDARALDAAGVFAAMVHALVKRVRALTQRPSVLLAGANSGAELPLLQGCDVTALDLSRKALARIPTMDGVHCVAADMQALPFPDRSFDAYIAFRAIHASNLDLERALAEAARVARSHVILSVSNGYNVHGTLMPGMYDYTKDAIDVQMAQDLSANIERYLSRRGFTCVRYVTPSEIIIFSERLPS